MWFFQGAHVKHDPLLLKESVDKSLELLEQGKLKGPHISGSFELKQVYSGKYDHLIQLLIILIFLNKKNPFQIFFPVFEAYKCQMSPLVGYNTKQNGRLGIVAL